MPQNVCGGDLAEYLRTKRDEGRPVTHTLLTGGKFHIADQDRASFHDAVAKAIHKGEMPAMSELRTAISPLFVDADAKWPVPTLTKESVVLVAAIATKQLRRFYAQAPLELFECIICVKAGGEGKAVAAEEGTPTLYKHGLHLHWPKILVDGDQAMRIVASMVAGLDRVDEWTSHFGVSRVVWEEVFDVSVYGCGLRLVGAPKASKCTNCNKSSKVCSVCGLANRQHVVDPVVYDILVALVGEEENESLTHRLKSNVCSLVRKTSVRCWEGEARTPGYAVYEGCPALPDRRRGGGKRKKMMGDADASKLSAKMRKHQETTDPAVHRVARALLVELHPIYAESRMSIRGDGASYTVLLTGDGAKFCINKNATHANQHVFMEISWNKFRNQYGAFMKCWCSCPAKRHTGVECKNFKSKPVSLTDEQVKLLFPSRPGDGRK